MIDLRCSAIFILVAEDLTALLLRVSDMRGSSRVSGDRKILVNKAYKEKCWICGRTKTENLRLTAAHIMRGDDIDPSHSS